MLKFILKSKFTCHDKALWSALILVAFFGFLRVSEFVTPSKNFYDPKIHLSPSDIEFSSYAIVKLTIKASKTAQFRKGVTIRLAMIEHQFCLVKALRNYLLFWGAKAGPLFVLSNGDFSFRIGGASTAASCGIPDSAIKTLGRWSSDSYRRYILSNSALRKWSGNMARLDALLSLLWHVELSCRSSLQILAHRS
ncbi:uncharacterized protein LOC130613448 [Hydractinia symbiolongicarpus]|uniref:uncharacterized protein LOC130613448 n=1 Tax=Hydractinia symbiolongicarpus TaxID=13093 RepID=UPI0025513915|nr:uncharacterized protein LOC130613448 [Hydractinia symbiolongicarpus]